MIAIELNKTEKIIIGVILTIVLAIIGLYIFQSINQENSVEIVESNEVAENLEQSENEINYQRETKNDKENKITVHVAGCVENEGVYQMKENSRVEDAIQQAGGLTSDANTKSINLAQKIQDGQKIYIPSVIEKETTIEFSTAESQEDEKVNINQATQTELETLPGIGPSTALKIIDYRKENGWFKTVEDLKNVPRNWREQI